MSRSVICPTGINAHECGYCKRVNEESSVSYGFISSRMMVTDYEQLMLQGWRRSGKYFYRPVMHETCCPMYTIRLPVRSFDMSKSQKKVLKQVDKKINKDISEGHTEISVTTERASFSAEKFAVYSAYQREVHHDAPNEITEEGFTNFLVSSPLWDNVTVVNGASVSASTSHGASPPAQQPAFGTFHQCYRLHNELIAVGVVDLLPSGLSSVYCFYNPMHKDLVLGKYTALQEIDWCVRQGFPYYYMGYYIHDCDKMRYKGEYKPSELLCPLTLQWYPLSQCVPLFERHKFTPLEPSAALLRDALSQDNAKDLQSFVSLNRDIPNEQLNRIPLDIGAGRPVVLGMLNENGQDFLRPLLTELVTYFDKTLLPKCIVKFQ